MKFSVKYALSLLLVLAIGGIAGYFIGTLQIAPVASSSARTVEQIVADTKAHSEGDSNGQLRVVTNQSVVMVVPYGKDRRCSLDYGATLTKISDLPKDFNRLATEINMESSQETNVLLSYRTPAKETGRLYANVPTCDDGTLIAANSLVFEQAQVPATQ